MKQCIIMTLAGFISGAVMYSYLIPKIFMNIDIRSVPGDGNPGSTNVIKAAGLPLGLLCMFLDVIKAFVPVFVGAALLRCRGVALIPLVLAPVAGHAFTPMLRFKGGKSISVTFGSLLGLITISRIVFLLAAILAAYRFVVVIRPDSSGVVTAFATFSVFVLFCEPYLSFKIALWLLSSLVTLKHLQNPDKGEPSVSVGHFSIMYKDNKLVLSKS